MGGGTLASSGHHPARRVAEFERCWPWLEQAIELYGHTHTKAHILSQVLRGQAHFWPGDNAAIVTNILRAPTGLTSVNGWLAGGELGEIAEMAPKIEAWAKGNIGCHRAIVFGRRGWLRALDGYREGGMRMVKDL
jgi:hypothetical protein